MTGRLMASGAWYGNELDSEADTRDVPLRAVCAVHCVMQRYAFSASSPSPADYIQTLSSPMNGGGQVDCAEGASPAVRLTIHRAAVFNLRKWSLGRSAIASSRDGPTLVTSRSRHDDDGDDVMILADTDSKTSSYCYSIISSNHEVGCSTVRRNFLNVTQTCYAITSFCFFKLSIT